jgi:hypothetical protein
MRNNVDSPVQFVFRPRTLALLILIAFIAIVAMQISIHCCSNQAHEINEANYGVPSFGHDLAVRQMCCFPSAVKLHTPVHVRCK